ncbi:DUF6560 family protein [Pseudobutyrivibrio xylanivorans]|uniref:Uncharacterized protein n=1 Tax=Pseudobutyrivibrio xylanivorans TaxID=185007 RepID=A0A1G5S6E4_PSEXY|nr:DUF6560 family protein [Pseudobutyrivibrio xylanivorans]SCZ81450.1 hypothetical protein SAMN02910350_02827 [Pseudobutyrivibrio xylanivorans]
MYIEFGLFLLIFLFTVFVIIGNIKNNKNDNNTEDPLETGVFSISEPLFVKNVIGVCLGGFSILLVVCIFAFYWQGFTRINLISCSVFFLAFLGGVLLFMHSQNWEISVDKEEITYKNFLGQVKYFNFKEIVVRKNRRHYISAYHDNKRIFSVGSDTAEYALFLWWANKYGVYVK